MVLSLTDALAEKFILLFQSLYANSRGHHDKLSSSKLISFISFFDTVINISLVPCEKNVNDICSDRDVSDLEYANVVLLMNEEPSKSESIFDCLNNSADMLGMCFASLKCKVQLLDWIGFAPDRTMFLENN